MRTTTTPGHDRNTDSARPSTRARRAAVIGAAAGLACTAAVSVGLAQPAQARPAPPPPGNFQQVVANESFSAVTICVNREVNNFTDNCIGGVGGGPWGGLGKINTPVGEGDFYLNVRSSTAQSNRTQTIAAPKDGDTNCWGYKLTVPGGLYSQDCINFG